MNNENDYITIVRYVKPANKLVEIINNKPVKSMAPSDGNYVLEAQSVHVPDAESLAEALTEIGKDPKRAVILGYVSELTHGTDLPEIFTIRAEATIREKTGIEGPLAGVHRIGGVRLPVVARLKDNFHPSSWILLDRDITEGMPDDFRVMDTEEYLQALDKIMPGVMLADRVVVPSTTGRVLHNGKPLQATGTHIYIKTQNADDLARFRKAILPRAHIAGLGFHKPVGGGGSRPWSVFDPSVFSPERLVFDGSPIVKGEGLAVADPSITWQASPFDEQFDTEQVAELSPDEERDWQRATGLRSGGAGNQSQHIGGLRLATELEVHFPAGDTGVITVQDFLEMGEDKLRANSPADDHFRFSESWNYILRLKNDGTPVLVDNGAGVNYELNTREADAVRSAAMASFFDDEDLVDDDRPRIPAAQNPEPAFDAADQTEDGGGDDGPSRAADTFDDDIDDFNPDVVSASKPAATAGAPAATRSVALPGYRGVLQEVESLLKRADDATRATKIKDAIDLMITSDLDPIQMAEVRELISKVGGMPKKDIEAYVKDRTRTSQGRAKVLSDDDAVSGRVIEWSEECPAWARDWVFICSENRYFNIANGATRVTEAFNISMAGFVPPDEEGKRPRPSEYLAQSVAIPSAERRSFSPGMPAVFLEETTNVTYVNAFDERPLRTLAAFRESIANGSATGDAEAVEVFRCHMELLIPDDRERAIMINWMRYQIEFPGEKVLWAPVLQGTQGNGKTKLFDLLKNIIGTKNVKAVRNAEVGKEFNAWAEGATVVCFEEIRMHGEKRYEFENALKENITNRQVTVRKMRTDPYETPNVTNYLLLTNHRDAVPVTEADRRYFVVFSPFEPSDSPTVDGWGGVPAYFEALARAIDDQPMSLAQWICGQPWHEDFQAKGAAPTTEAKHTMITMAAGSADQRIKDLLEDSNNPYYCREYIAAEELLKVYTNMFTDKMTMNHLHQILERLGYDDSPRRVLPVAGNGSRRFRIKFDRKALRGSDHDLDSLWDSARLRVQRLLDNDQAMDAAF